MENHFGNITASTFQVADTITNNGPILNSAVMTTVRSSVEDLQKTVDDVVESGELDTPVRAGLESTMESVSAEIAKPAPDRGRLVTLVARIREIAAGTAAAAEIVESVDSVTQILTGV
ncbi:MAG: hypothetical protein OJJ54_22505 [Pseudonocardia sp.]|nr:hypothetical protein [Pseudonocardia sp.]